MSRKMREAGRERRPDWVPVDLKDIGRIRAERRRARPSLRRLRQELGLSQAEAARLLGTTQSNVSKIEAKEDPPLAVLRRLIESRGGRLKMVAVFEDGKQVVLAE